MVWLMLAVCGGLLSFRRLTQVLGAHHLRPRAEAHLEKGPTTPSTRQLFLLRKILPWVIMQNVVQPRYFFIETGIGKSTYWQKVRKVIL